MMGCLRSLFFENSGVDPDGSKKSGANCPSSAASLVKENNYGKSKILDMVS